jgi:hypothetical protein
MKLTDYTIVVAGPAVGGQGYSACRKAAWLHPWDRVGWDKATTTQRFSKHHSHPRWYIAKRDTVFAKLQAKPSEHMDIWSCWDPTHPSLRWEQFGRFSWEQIENILREICEDRGWNYEDI